MLRRFAAPVTALALSACANGPIDPIELVDSSIRPHDEHPELSVLDDGTVMQRYLVQLRGDLFSEGLANDVIVDLATRDSLRLEHVYTRVYGGFAVALTEDQAERLRQRPEVEAVIADARVDAVKGPPGSGGGTPAPMPTSNWGLLDVLVDPSLRHDGLGASVAVLDTGIAAHGNLPASTCVGDFTNTVGTCNDGDGHGTHVAGTIAASPSTAQQGHQGIAPAVSLGVAKVLSDSGSGSNAGIVGAINAVAGNYDVLNLSLGGATYGSAESTDPLCVAITGALSAGTVSVVAAGNDARDASGFSPARCDDALTVAAHDVAKKTAYFSNYGADVDTSAPGVTIYSTTNDGSFGAKSGTSMASPHAAAVAALYAATHPGETAEQVMAGVIANSADRAAPTQYSRKIKVTAKMLDGTDYAAAAE
jgi:subtilisin family serine protease